MNNINLDKLQKEIEKDLDNKLKEIEKGFDKKIWETITGILDEIELGDEFMPDISINFRCSEGDRMKCRFAVIKATLLELMQKGYLNEKFFKSNNPNPWWKNTGNTVDGYRGK